MKLSFLAKLTRTALLLVLIVSTHIMAADVQTDLPWVSCSDDGKLCYQTNSRGDHILDFSYAGYGGGGVKLPDVPVRKEVPPSGRDDSSIIQAAMDAVAALPLTNGFHGAVLLKPGIFHCAGQLLLSQDGVVLRGSGSGKDGTLIEMTGDPHVCVAIAGDRLRVPDTVAATSSTITDAYVPSGAASFSVMQAEGFAVGDGILIRRPATSKWIHFMGMDSLVRNGKPQTWIRTDSLITTERHISSIQGNRITLDVPLTDAIEARFLTPAAAVVVKATSPRRLVHCGIESLQINSPPPGGALANQHNDAATLQNCEDCWVKDVAIRNTLGDVTVLAGARRITLEEIHADHAATVAKGAGASADFLIRGSQVLLDRCTSTGNGAFYIATLDTEATLNVALNCQFQGTGSIQPHMRWSTGLLLDDCYLADGQIAIINRKTMGSGHGWTMGWAVVWNCSAKGLEIQQPPGAMNWCIGSSGKLAMDSRQTNPWLSSPGTPVVPRSLYLAQLQERLGKIALKNIGY